MRTAGVFITRRCNLRCPYCNVPKLNTPELTFEQWIKAIKILKKLNVNKIHFLGGEPTLYDKFFDVIEYVVNNTNMECSFTTNGVTSNGVVKKIIEKFGKKVGIGISIDELNLTNSISPAKSKCGLNLIDYLKENNLFNKSKIIVYTVLNKKNVDTVVNDIKHFSSQGISSYILPFHWDREERFVHRKANTQFAFVTEEDVEKFGKVIDQLIELKNSGILINNTEEYLKFTKEHIQKLDGRCTMLSEIRINCDGKLMCCCDKNGEVFNYFTIFDLENENKLNDFLKMQESDRATCAGCLWPSVYESAIREKK